MKPPHPNKVYRLLFKRFGPQGWWPLIKVPSAECRVPSAKKKIGPKYHPGRYPLLRREQAFEIAVGAVLTQNTSWANVEKALMELDSHSLFSPKKLLATRYSLLASLIRPSGYFRQKAKKLNILAGFVAEKCGGDLRSLRSRRNAGGAISLISSPRSALGGARDDKTERLRIALLGLWGIGPETADSILLYALDQPIFVVDAFTRRIGERLGWPFLERAGGKEQGARRIRHYEDIRLFFENSLPKDVHLYQEYHALFVRLAKEYCHKKNPQCRSCPLIKVCVMGRQARLSPS